MSKPKSPRRVAENEALAVGNTIRGSARKLNLVAQLIRGRKVEEALNILKFSPKAMAEEGARRRELAELHPDHVLIDRHRHELAAVVDIEGQADELRQDRRAARPGLDRCAL
jgi:ribosomal protein L22